MRRKLILLTTALAAVFACNTEQYDILHNGTPAEESLVVITASQENGPDTRTVLDEDLIHVLWTPEDRINVFYQDKSACFTSVNTEGNVPVAQFKGQMSIDVITGGGEGSSLDSVYFWGLYPYSEEAAFNLDKDYIKTYLPKRQVAEKNSFADDLFISIGRSTSWNMPFYNVCSGLRFTVDQTGIKGVTLRSNGGEPLAGTFQVGFDEDTQRPAVLGVTDGSDEIHLTPPEGEMYFSPETYYYIVTLPGTLESGFTITLEGLDGKMELSRPVTFNRSRFISTKLTAERYYSHYLSGIDLDIENDGVRKYLDDVDYSEDLVNYNYSYIADYISLGKDKPAPVTFNWASTGSRSLTVIDSVTGQTVYDGDASGDKTEIYNLIPGREYTYKVGGDVAWESSFTPEGRVRMMDVDGVRNVRDLGGWKAGDKTIRYGKVYRGARLEDITAEGKKAFLDLMGVTADVDLRGTNEGGDVLDLHYYRYSTLYLMGGTGQTASLYRDAIRRIIQLLSEGETVYFHCRVGADRTGTLAFLIEALLGVSESDLSKDFELTSFSDEKRVRNNGGGTFALYKMIPYLRGFAGNNIQEQVTSWATTGDSALSPSEIEQLKSLLLE